MRRWYYIGVVAMVICTGCKSSRHQQTEASVPARELLSDNDKQRLQNLYLESVKQRLLNNNTAAYELLQQCKDICSEVSEVLYDDAIFDIAMRNDSIALLKLHKAQSLDPKNTFYLETLASCYLNKREGEKALPYLEQMAALQPSRSDVLSQLVTIYATLKRPKEAIEALNKIELIEGKLASVSYQKFLLYKQMKEEKKAFDELESLCKEYPHELSYRLTIADELLKSDKIAEAQAIYDEVRNIDPENGNLKLSMLEYYRVTHQDTLFLATRDTLIYHSKTQTDIRIALLRDYIKEEIKKDSLGTQRVRQTLGKVDSLYPKDLALLKLQAAYLATYESKNDSAFLAIMDRLFEVEPEDMQPLYYMMQFYGDHGQYDKLEAICRKGVLLHPEELVCHFYLGLACFQQKDTIGALKAFQDGIVHQTPDSKPAMVAELYSVMGDMLHELNRHEEAYAAYDSCLAYQDDKMMCLNNYAYFLCLDHRDLDKAEEMSYRTVRYDPKNATYLDTYAWILFTREDYAGAQPYIDKVCNPELADSTLEADSTLTGVVLEHAGDIAAQNGNIEQAMRFWNLAAKREDKDTSAVLPKKITLKKYIPSNNKK